MPLHLLSFSVLVFPLSHFEPWLFGQDRPYLFARSIQLTKKYYW